MDISTSLYTTAEKVSSTGEFGLWANTAWDTIVEYAGRFWAWLSTNIPDAWNTIRTSVAAAWAAVMPGVSAFGTWVATYQVEVAAAVVIAVVATLAARVIYDRLSRNNPT